MTKRFNRLRKSRTTHGLTKHPLYNTWKKMIYRCTVTTNKDYKNYGAKGIQVYVGWRQAPPFIKWAISHGWRKGCQIHRKNSNTGYTPINCVILTSADHAILHKKTRPIRRRVSATNALLSFGN